MYICNVKVEEFFKKADIFFKRYNIKLIQKNNYAIIYDLHLEHLVIERHPKDFINCYFVKDGEILNVLRIKLERPLRTFTENVRRRMLLNLNKYEGI